MIPVIDRLIRSGEANPRIRIRDVDKSKFNEEAAIILDILNDAWSDNWGFVPLTDAEIAYAGKKLKPIIVEDLVKIAEVDGEPVAFMITIPDINEMIRDLDGKLFPFGWAKLLWRLHKVTHQAGARPADGRAQVAPGRADGEPAGLHADRIHPPRLRRQIWHQRRRVRLGAGGQSGNDVDRPVAGRGHQPRLSDL